MAQPLQKNSGPLLTSKKYGSVQHFPEEFLATIGLVTLTQQNPVDVEPTRIGVIDLLVESSVLQERTDERKRVDVFLTEIPDTTLDAEVMLPNQLVASNQRLLVPDPTDLVVSVLTESATQHNLGNGWLDQTIVTAPSLFHEQLLARERQLLVSVPPEFRSGISLLSTSEVLEGTVADPGPLTGLAEYHSEQQLTVFKKKVEERGIDLATLLGTLTNYRMTPEQQLETLGIQLTNVEPSPSSFTALTVESEIKALGGGLWLVTEGTVPEVFDHTRLVVERDILGNLPAEFRSGISRVTASEEIAGIVTLPVLTAGLEYASEEQITEFKKRVEERAIDFDSLTSLTDYRMTPEQQLETITKEVTTTAPTPSSFTALTVDSEIRTLGGGLWLQVEGTVPEVFDKGLIVVQRELFSSLPSEFRSLLTEETVSIEEAGPAYVPTLVAGQSSVSVQRVTEFKRRVESRGINLDGLPINLSSQETFEEFGGGILDSFYHLGAFPFTIDEGLRFVGSKVRDLGAGLYSKESKILHDTEWPTLTGIGFDKEMQVPFDFEEQVVDPSYTPTVAVNTIETVTPIDKWRSKRRKVTKTPTAVGSDSAIVTFAYHPFRFPGLLTFAGAGYYVRASDSQLCRHTTRTWWEVSSTTPVIVVDEIIMDNPIISTLNNTSTLAYAGPCIHDDFFSFITLHWPATTPSYTTYVGSWIGNEKIVAATVDRTDIPDLWKIQTISVVMR